MWPIRHSKLPELMSTSTNTNCRASGSTTVIPTSIRRIWRRRETMMRYFSTGQYLLVNCRLSIRTAVVTSGTSTICGKSAPIMISSTPQTTDTGNIFGKFLSLQLLHSDAGRAAATAGTAISICGPAAFFYTKMYEFSSFRIYLHRKNFYVIIITESEEIPSSPTQNTRPPRVRGGYI